MTERIKRSGIGYLFVAPAFVHLIVFALLPIGFALYLSFYQWDILKEDKPFVGFANYFETFTNDAFWNAMWNSFRYALWSVPIGMAVALGVAILVNQKLRGVTVFRTIFYIPAISSGVAISMVWIYIYLQDVGMINTFLKWIGGEEWGKTDFLNQDPWAMRALIFMSIWTGLGPRMVLFLAGLVSIPQSLYEAAELDGASRWKCFRHITLPMLAPTTLFVLVIGTIGAFQVFTPVYMMTRGGPADTTDVVGYHIYNEAWRKFHVGSASAQSFVLLAAILVVAYIQYRMMKRQLEGYSAA